ncbi:MAG: hypothetical protein AB7U05_07590 [Mangrovibacterium sp.]
MNYYQVNVVNKNTVISHSFGPIRTVDRNSRHGSYMKAFNYSSLKIIQTWNDAYMGQYLPED